MKHLLGILAVLCLLACTGFAAAETSLWHDVCVPEAGIRLQLPGSRLYFHNSIPETLRELDHDAWMQQVYLRALLKRSDVDEELADALRPYLLDGVMDSPCFTDIYPDSEFRDRFVYVTSSNSVNLSMRRTLLTEDSALDTPEAIEEIAAIIGSDSKRLKEVTLYRHKEEGSDKERTFVFFKTLPGTEYESSFFAFVSGGYLILVDSFEVLNYGSLPITEELLHQAADSVVSFTPYATWTYANEALDMTMTLPVGWQLHKEDKVISFVRETEAGRQVVLTCTRTNLWNPLFGKSSSASTILSSSKITSGSLLGFRFSDTEFYRKKYADGDLMKSEYSMNNNFRRAEHYARALGLDASAVTPILLTDGHFRGQLLYYQAQTTLDDRPVVLLFRVCRGFLYTLCYQGQVGDDGYPLFLDAVSSIYYGSYHLLDIDDSNL